MPVGLEPGPGGGDLVERKRAVDDRPEPAVGHRRQQVGQKSLGRFGALRRRAQPVADAVEVQAPLGEPIDIELSRRDTAHPADRDEPSADGECFETGDENVAADIVDDHVDTLLADNPGDRLAEPSLPVTTPASSP